MPSSRLHIERLFGLYRLPPATGAPQALRDRLDALAATAVRAAIERRVNAALPGLGVPLDAKVAVRRIAVRVRVRGVDVSDDALADAWARAIVDALLQMLAPLILRGGGVTAEAAFFRDRFGAEHAYLLDRLHGVAEAWWWRPILGDGGGGGGAPSPRDAITGWISRTPELAPRALAALAAEAPERWHLVLTDDDARALAEEMVGGREARIASLREVSSRPGRALMNVAAPLRDAGDLLSAPEIRGALCEEELQTVALARTPALQRLLVVSILLARRQSALSLIRPDTSVHAEGDDATPAIPEHPAGVAEHPAGVAEHPAGVAEHPAGVAEHPAGVAEHPAGVAEHPAGIAEHPAGVAEHPAGVAEHPAGVAEAPRAGHGRLGEPRGREAVSRPTAEARRREGQKGLRVFASLRFPLPGDEGTARARALEQAALHGLSSSASAPALAGAGAPAPQELRVCCAGLLFLVRRVASSSLFDEHRGGALRDRLVALGWIALHRALDLLPKRARRAAFERERPLLEVFSGVRDLPEKLHVAPVGRAATDAAAQLDALAARLPVELGPCAGGVLAVYGPGVSPFDDHPHRVIAHLLLRPAALDVTEVQADLRLPAGALDVALRLGGWDIDPGFVPHVGRVIRFHYEER